MHRQYSERRLHAVQFLSNISLDGSYNDNDLCQHKLSDSTNQGEPETGTTDEDKENKPNNNLESAKNGQASFNIDTTLPAKEAHQRRDILDIIERSGTSSPVSLHIRERTISEGGRRSDFPKKRGANILGSDKTSCFSSSSNESLVTSGFGGPSRKISSSVSETSTSQNKEPIFVKLNPYSQVKDERLSIVSSWKFPIHTFSIIQHNRSCRMDLTVKESARRRHPSANRPLSIISDRPSVDQIFDMTHFEEAREVSYSEMLVPTSNFSRSKRQYMEAIEKDKHPPQHPVISRCYSYEPATHKATAHYLPHNAHSMRSASISVSSTRGLLKSMELGASSWRKTMQEKEELQLQMTPGTPVLVDDPELQAGKHRKLLRFPSYLTSSIDYTKPSELKKELNDKFKDKFPHIQLTLSKLRSLKRELLKIARQDCEIDLLTVAQAYAYFEQILLLDNIVNKQTRKLVAGACLVLSAKLNDVKGEALSNLLEKTENALRLNRKDLLNTEVVVLIALEFGLHLPTWKIVPHYQRLLFES